MTEQSTVRTVTYDLLRSLGMTTIFGNPGSTEETFLQEFPGDFRYVLALQEASAIAMADAFAQVTRRPALVNLHSSAGVGNAMGNLVAAWHGNTPLIVTAGQQQRELMIGEPYLGNREATTMPKPWVKWSYEPYRAQDVPEAFMRAYAMALQPQAGPVFLSIPLDDWNQPQAGPARVRTVSNRVSPDPERLRLFADRISASRRPALVFGPDVDRSGGWDTVVTLAEKLHAAVYGSPLLDRASFPEDHPLLRGPLGMSVKTISDRLAGHDLAVVIGAEVFRYYPYIPGDFLPAGAELLQITASPEVAAAARVGDALLGRSQDRDRGAPGPGGRGLGADRPGADGATAPASGGAEQPAHPAGGLRRADPGQATGFGHRQRIDLHHGPADRVTSRRSGRDRSSPRPAGASAGAVPAANGVALADRDRGVSGPVIGLIGDGSSQYSVQALWTAAQHQLPVVYVVMRNEEYSILKSFAVLEETPGVPGLDLPGLGVSDLARGFGCRAVDVTTAEELEQEFKAALSAEITTVIVVRTQPQKAML